MYENTNSMIKASFLRASPTLTANDNKQWINVLAIVLWLRKMPNYDKKKTKSN